MSMDLPKKTIDRWTQEDARSVLGLGVIAWFLVLITTIVLASLGAFFAATVTAMYLVGFPTWILLIGSRTI